MAEKVASGSNAPGGNVYQGSSGLPVITSQLGKPAQVNQTLAATLAAGVQGVLPLLGVQPALAAGGIALLMENGFFTVGLNPSENMALLGLNISGLNDLTELTLFIQRDTTLNSVVGEAFNLLGYNTMDAFQNTKYTVPCNMVVRPGERVILTATSTAGGVLSIQGIVKNC